MTDPENRFTVGQRAYWISEEPGLFGLGMTNHVRDGVVMSTGPAVTQVWYDGYRDPRDHHALTFANDRIWPDRLTPVRISHEKYLADKARREAEESS